MSDVVDLKKKWNHRWKTDPRFIKGFDYEKPEHADVPDGLKWALPIHESLKAPEVKARSNKIREESEKRVKKNLRDKRKEEALRSRKLSVID